MLISKKKYRKWRLFSLKKKSTKNFVSKESLIFFLGVRIPQLIAMKIVANGDVLTTQPDFEEMSGFHEHSRERWQRKSETPKECLLQNTIFEYL